MSYEYQKLLQSWIAMPEFFLIAPAEIEKFAECYVANNVVLPPHEIEAMLEANVSARQSKNNKSPTQIKYSLHLPLFK